MKVNPPNFEGWTTSRIRFLLIDYKDTIRTLAPCRQNRDIFQMYYTWIRALEKELAKRKY